LTSFPAAGTQHLIITSACINISGVDAAEMARKRWEGVACEERSRIARRAVLARWQRANAKDRARARERAEYARRVRARRLAARHGPELRRIARTYVWWKEPAQSLKESRHFLLYVMQYATWSDATTVLEVFGRNSFAKALRSALPGILSDKSWRFWHIYLGLAAGDRVPSMPRRQILDVGAKA
jgi:hypothetical protein